jgi:nucleoside-diphosphate-sugar epimerase
MDVVHHCAALVPLTKAGNRFLEVNAIGSGIVAEACVRAKVKRMILLSSSAVYGKNQSPIRQGDIPIPAEEYGQSKLGGEKLAEEVCAIGDIPITIIRPRTIVGHGRLGIFDILFEWVRDSRKIYTIGDGSNIFQIIDAQDLIDLHMLLMDDGISGKFNAGAREFGTLKAMLQGLIARVGSSSKVVALPRRPAEFALNLLDKTGLSPLSACHYLNYGRDYYFDAQPLIQLGWRPAWSNEDAIYNAYYWWSQQPKEKDGNSVHRSPAKQKILRLLKMIS